MLKTKYDVLVRNGKERFVVIPEHDYKAMCEYLEDEADFRAIEASKKRQATSRRYTLEQIKQELGMLPRKRKRRS